MAIDALIGFLELETPISKVMNYLQIITRKKSEASVLVKKALQELKLIVQNADLLGIEVYTVIYKSKL